MDNYYQLVADTFGFEAAMSKLEQCRGMNSAEWNYLDNGRRDGKEKAFILEKRGIVLLCFCLLSLASSVGRSNMSSAPMVSIRIPLLQRS